MNNSAFKPELDVFDPNPKDIAEHALVVRAKWNGTKHFKQFAAIMDIVYDEGCHPVILGRCFDEITQTCGPCTIYVGTIKQCLLVKGSLEEMGAIVEIEKI